MVPWFDITIVLTQATFRTGFEFAGEPSAGSPRRCTLGVTSDQLNAVHERPRPGKTLNRDEAPYNHHGQGHDGTKTRAVILFYVPTALDLPFLSVSRMACARRYFTDISLSIARMGISMACIRKDGKP
jgi:hypothetical protein